MTSARLLLAAALIAFSSGTAHAHTGGRGFVLLLPTHLYLAGGALVVALSFVVVALIPVSGLRAVERLSWRLGGEPRRVGIGPSLVSLAVVLALVVAGHAGSRDPLVNPLPTTVWMLWWVGFTFLHAIAGNLWAHLNPWSGLYRLITALPALRGWRDAPPLAWPRWLGHWPAFALFLAFAWFELVDPAPQDPARLANAVALYLVGTLAAMLLFGERTWLGHGEAFALFFRMVSWLSPFGRARDDGSETHAPPVSLTLPGLGLLRVGALPAGAAAFVLLALASVSFDGLSRTFWWLGLIGENPLEYPGRTALMTADTLGLIGTFLALAAAYAIAVTLGRAFSGGGGSVKQSFGVFVVSIVPIAFGYHFAHYLPSFLVDSQYALVALSDPFALGWNLLGTGDWHVTASFLAHHDSVTVIWNLQAAGIVGAHVLAVAVAHLLALGGSASVRAAVLSQIPMTVLMVGYTLFGLWLLSTPTAG